MKAFEMLASREWAMHEPALREFLGSFVKAEHGDRPEHPAPALLAPNAQPLRGGSRWAQVVGGTAIIPVHGPLMWQDDFLTDWYDIRTYESILRDVHAAEADRSVTGILYHIHTPGGEAAGCSLTAETIRGGQKPALAYVPGWAASAGYWLAAAAPGGMVIDSTAMLGSIGVRAAYLDWSKLMEKIGVREIVIVSDQSPHKDTDPAEPEGAARIRATLTELAAVFVAAVARYRGVEPAAVVNDFGRGWVKIGDGALQAGMADRIGSFEDALAQLAERVQTKAGLPVGITSTTRTTMSQANEAPAAVQGQPATITRATLEASNPELVAQIRAEGREEGAVAENARILAIEGMAVAGFESIIDAAKRDRSVTADVTAVRIIQAQQGEGKQRLQALSADEAAVDAPDAGAIAGTEGGKPSTEAKVRGILANAGRRMRGDASRN